MRYKWKKLAYHAESPYFYKLRSQSAISRGAG